MPPMMPVPVRAAIVSVRPTIIGRAIATIVGRTIAAIISRSIAAIIGRSIIRPIARAVIPVGSVIRTRRRARG
jgi:hypothetical protein